MKCPKCKDGELSLYKVTEKVYRIPLTSKNTLSKRKIHTMGSEYDTTMDYLECSKCKSEFEYELDEKGKVLKDLLWERESS
ncbi:hypothetical protein [Halalkalibacter oceani]|uniref:hypothetical protein n=1 Tax=Halalkalibacter oceani TaxID=1653776 RepID=UPI0033951B8F